MASTARARAEAEINVAHPGLFGWKSINPRQPATIRIATIPSDVAAAAAAAATPMTTSDAVPAAALPRRYTATAKRASTTGPRP